MVTGKDMHEEMGKGVGARQSRGAFRCQRECPIRKRTNRDKYHTTTTGLEEKFMAA